MIAEMPFDRERLTDLLRDASMRPRSDDRGNDRASGHAEVRHRVASMRPRSDDRGNSAYPTQLIFNNLPSRLRAATFQMPECESFMDTSFI